PHGDTRQNGVRKGVAHQAHPTQLKKHAERGGADGERQANHQRAAHKAVLNKRLKKEMPDHATLTRSVFHWGTSASSRSVCGKWRDTRSLSCSTASSVCPFIYISSIRSISTLQVASSTPVKGSSSIT